MRLCSDEGNTVPDLQIDLHAVALGGVPQKKLPIVLTLQFILPTFGFHRSETFAESAQQGGKVSAWKYIN
jgi:hypothetical protein